MKKIAVLTDFSERAEQAARYAVRLAQYIRADVVLYHSFPVPYTEPNFATFLNWPMEDLSEIRNDSNKELSKLEEKLKQEWPLTSEAGFRPGITSVSTPAVASLNLGDLSADKEIVLCVIGSHQNGVSGFMTGNHVLEIIDKVKVPVLMVPEHYAFDKIRKIAFATDLDNSDLDVINSVSGLAAYFSADIMLSHIDAESASNSEKGKYVKEFLRDVTNKIPYPHIYYRSVTNDRVKGGLIWLNENVDFDMLVMVHRHRGFLNRLLGLSETRKITELTSVPLLIYPSPVPSMPVF
ncbi:MAG TPA: universal stress protein [Mucilaginibacter sp.]|nr:universal stress protein [Mucilaginibacter sp.]